MRMTSGSTAMARAMQRRCCWPPESAVPGCLSLSLTSSQRAARRRLLLDELVHVALEAGDARSEGDVLVDRLGERVGLLEDHADAPADLDRVDPGVVEVHAVVEDLAAVVRAPARGRSCG